MTITENQVNLQINGKPINRLHEVANCFNYFATVADKTVQQISFESHSLKPKTSPGIDEISARLTKVRKTELTDQLINRSLQ